MTTSTDQYIDRIKAVRLSVTNFLQSQHVLPGETDSSPCSVGREQRRMDGEMEEFVKKVVVIYFMASPTCGGMAD